MSTTPSGQPSSRPDSATGGSGGSPRDREYGQLVFISLDLEGSERMGQSLSPQGNRELLDRYRAIVHDEVERAGGAVGGWQGDGAMAFLGTTGDEDPLIQQGEWVARSILDRLCGEVPEVKARLGVDSRPARFYTDVGRIFSEGAILAARLQAFGRRVARGAVLIVSPQVQAPLDAAVRAMYREVQGPGTQVFAYVPERCGEWLQPSEGGRRQRVRIRESEGSPLIELPPEPWERDPRWPFRGGHELQFVVATQPREIPNFSLPQNREWIQSNFLKLPIGSHIFRDPNEVRFNEILFKLAESREAPAIQFCKFYGDGSFAFGDRGWASMSGWQGAFYPEATRRPISDVLQFLRDFYSHLGLRETVRASVLIENVVGCVRRTDPARHPGSAGRFEYDQSLFHNVITTPEGLWPSAAEQLYRYVLTASNLDPELWARPIQGNDRRDAA